MDLAIFNGLISERNGNFSEIVIDGECLADSIDYLNSEYVGVKYFISNHPIDENTLDEDYLSCFYGISRIDGQYISGSEWTGVYDKNDIFEVGGHDLMLELSNHIGEYCYLQIETL